MTSYSDSPTTIDFPVGIPTVRHGDHWIARTGDTELRLSNLTKVFWPETGYTKGDLLTYYFNVALTLLPHVFDRPLTLKRMPDGVAGPYFYAKDAPSYTPRWMPILAIEAETEERTIRFLTVRDVASLLWVANLGCIELHPHHTRGPTQENPTYAVFDLDPFPPAGLDEAKETASFVKLLLDRLGLISYAKTSGATGIQVYVPLDGTHTYDEARAFVAALCEMIQRAAPQTTTVEWEVSKRAGKVFLDANMNRAGASLAAAYSVRARLNAPVSTAFEWSELDQVDPEDFTIATVLGRISERGDAFAGVATGPGQSLCEAMKELGVEMPPARRRRI